MNSLVDLPAPEVGEIAVIGLARSGRGVAKLLNKKGYRVYASDAGASDALGSCITELNALGIEARAGGHDLGRVGKAALIVVSPGVPPDAPPVELARANGIRVASEVEVALHFLQSSSIIAVTGTNGKTTTTALIAHILREINGDAMEAGNIGTALSEVAFAERHPAWIALEMSSFQLHDTPSLQPLVGVLTNLSPDHLDRYSSVEDYYADKARMFASAHSASRWVLNGDDPQVGEMTAAVPGEHHMFSVRQEADAFYRTETDELVLFGDSLLARKELPLLGAHNVANALAAALAVAVADPSHATREARLRISAALKTFRPLPHRLELVGEFAGVQWIDDYQSDERQLHRRGD